MAKSHIGEKKIACQGKASEDDLTRNLVKSADWGFGNMPLAEAGKTINIANVSEVGAARNEERSRSSEKNAAIYANARGFLHVMWDDVRVCNVETRAAVRRDPLVTALFGATAQARE